MSKIRILVLFYGLHGREKELALEAQNAIEEAGHICQLRQVKDDLTDEQRVYLQAPMLDKTITFAKIDDLVDCDAIMFGFCARQGAPPHELLCFLEQSSGLWMEGKLIGKPVCCFTTNPFQNSGQETGIFTLLPFLIHQGMIFVPLGAFSDVDKFSQYKVHGASFYGAGALIGKNGYRALTKLDKDILILQAKSFLEVAKYFTYGRQPKQPTVPVMKGGNETKENINKQNNEEKAKQVEETPPKTQPKTPPKNAKIEKHQQKNKCGCAC